MKLSVIYYPNAFYGKGGYKNISTKCYQILIIASVIIHSEMSHVAILTKEPLREEEEIYKARL